MQAVSRKPSNENNKFPCDCYSFYFKTGFIPSKPVCFCQEHEKIWSRRPNIVFGRKWLLIINRLLMQLSPIFIRISDGRGIAQWLPPPQLNARFPHHWKWYIQVVYSEIIYKAHSPTQYTVVFSRWSTFETFCQRFIVHDGTEYKGGYLSDVWQAGSLEQQSNAI